MEAVAELLTVQVSFWVNKHIYGVTLDENWPSWRPGTCQLHPPRPPCCQQSNPTVRGSGGGDVHSMTR